MARRISADTVVFPFAELVDSLLFNTYFLPRSNQNPATVSPQTIAVCSFGKKWVYALPRTAPVPGVQKVNAILKYGLLAHPYSLASQ